MNSGIISKYRQLALLSLLLILLNGFYIEYADIFYSRVIRISSALILFIFFIINKGYAQKYVFTAFVMFLLRDLVLIDYEHTLNKTWSFLVGITGYLLLVFPVLMRVKLKRSTPVIILLVSSLLVLNVFNVYYLSDVVLIKLDNELQSLLFFVQAGVLLVLGFVAFMYHDRFAGKTPLLFLYISLCVILSDLSGLGSYYFSFEIAAIPERVFYILALTLMTAYTLNLNYLAISGMETSEKEYIL